MYIITNGKIVTEERILEGYSLVIEEDKIVNILKNEDLLNLEGELLKLDKAYIVVDAKGGYISPGFIDIHSDYIETITSPRPNLLIDLNVSIKECERILCSHGITTMYHSLSFYGEEVFGVKLVRDINNVRKLMELIDDTHSKKHLIRHRLHGRVEVDSVNQVESIKDFIKEGKIHLLSFMDHTPGQGQYRNLEHYEKTLKSYLAIDEDIQTIVENQQQKETITVEILEEMIHLAKSKNIAVASHDDDTIEKLNFVNNMGITISEFPITMEAADYAKHLGMYRVAGSPNVLLGGSHSGNMSAAKGVVEKNINILCSDYYPASLLHSVFILHEKYHQDLCQMFKLVTINPAKAVNMDHMIGSIEVGKKADIVIINKDDEDKGIFISDTFVDGKLVCQFDYRK